MIITVEFLYCLAVQKFHLIRVFSEVEANAQRKKIAGDMMKNLDAKEIGTEAILGSPKPCLSKRHSDLALRCSGRVQFIVRQIKSVALTA